MIDPQYTSARRPPRGYIHIYSLINCATGQVFYIGQTRQAPRRRLQAHIYRYLYRHWDAPASRVSLRYWPHWTIRIDRTVRACNARRVERAAIRRAAMRGIQLTNKEHYR